MLEWIHKTKGVTNSNKAKSTIIRAPYHTTERRKLALESYKQVDRAPILNQVDGLVERVSTVKEVVWIKIDRKREGDGYIKIGNYQLGVLA